MSNPNKLIDEFMKTCGKKARFHFVDKEDRDVQFDTNKIILDHFDLDKVWIDEEEVPNFKYVLK